MIKARFVLRLLFFFVFVVVVVFSMILFVPVRIDTATHSMVLFYTMKINEKKTKTKSLKGNMIFVISLRIIRVLFAQISNSE